MNQNELLKKLDTSATRAESATNVYYEVLTPGVHDIPVENGETVPSLDKRLRGLVAAVTSVNDQIGDIEITPASIGLGSAALQNVGDLMRDVNLKDSSGYTQESFNSQWIDVSYKLTGNAAKDTAIVLSAIASAKSTGKGIRCAARSGSVTLNGNIDFSGIRYIDWQRDIIVATGAVIVGGLAGGAVVDIKFKSITNGTSTITGPFPTADTFKIFGVKAGVVTVGQTNLLRIHANGAEAARNSNGYFTLNLHGHVRAFRVSDEGADGWNNNITVLGGRIVDLDVTGTGYIPNELTFDYNTFEGPEVKIRFKKAWSNKVQNARFENTSAAPGIIFESDTMQNSVIQRWSGSGSTRGQFTFMPPVTDLGRGNSAITQSLIDFNQVDILNVNSLTSLIGNATSSASLNPDLNRSISNSLNKPLFNAELDGISILTQQSVSILSALVPVQNGDAVTFDCIYSGASFRPFIYIYDENKNPIRSDIEVDAILFPGAVFNANGYFAPASDVNSSILNVGLSINSQKIKHIRIGFYNGAVNAKFKSMKATLHTQKIRKYTESFLPKSTTMMVLDGAPTFGNVPLGSVYFNKATGKNFVCTQDFECSTTAASTGNIITVNSARDVSIGSIVGITDATNKMQWRTVTALSGVNLTLSSAVSVSANARVISNTWASND